MKTYTANNDSKQANKINWEWCKEFGANFIGGNAYDYAVIVRKNGERLMCSDAETWEENTKGLRMASVAYVVMWCAYEYTDTQREEAKANGERLTRGCSSVVDFTANECGYAEFLEEVTANSSNTECEYYNGTTGAVEKCNGIADTVAEDYAQKTGESEQYKQFAEAQKLNSTATMKAARKAERLCHKYAETLSAEDKGAWLEAIEERQRLEEIESRYNEQWNEIHEAWNARHMPALEAFVARQEAREAEQTTDTPAEAVETATEGENDNEQDNTPQSDRNAATAELFAVSLEVVECLRDIETLTEEEAAEKYPADLLRQAEELGERETTEEDTDPDFNRYRPTPRTPEVVDVLTFRNGSDSSEIVTIKLYDNGRTYCENTDTTAVMTLDEWENMRHVLYDLMGWGVTEGAK